MDARDKPLTPKPSCEELEPAANPARFTARVDHVYGWPGSAGVRSHIRRCTALSAAGVMVRRSRTTEHGERPPLGAVLDVAAEREPHLDRVNLVLGGGCAQDVQRQLDNDPLRPRHGGGRWKSRDFSSTGASKKPSQVLNIVFYLDRLWSPAWRSPWSFVILVAICRGVAESKVSRADAEPGARRMPRDQRRSVQRRYWYANRCAAIVSPYRPGISAKGSQVTIW
jgi:hypothetical protein